MKIPDVSRDTVLLRRPDLTIQLTSSGEVQIAEGGAACVAGPHALAILDAFSEPRTLGEAVADLTARGARDFAMLTTTILELASQGVLTVPGAKPTLGDEMGWDASSIHAKMLGDFERTEAFLAAIEEVVHEDDVVVDIGTGTGVLALGAARAGARKVYAIESSGIADVAARMFERNASLGARVALLRGWSTRVTLPERASVLVSETVGNQALGENIVDTVLDAHARLLSPGARLIPSRIRIYVQPSVLPEPVRKRHVFSKPNSAAWSARYGMDFTALAESTRELFALMLQRDEAFGWKRLGPPALAAEIDLQAPETSFEKTFAMAIDTAGDLDGLLETFELTLSPSVDFGCHPDRVAPTCSWHFPIWVLTEPRTVTPGERLHARYRYRAGRGKLSLDA